MAKLILLRHGQSQWNLENRFTGSVDVSLSDSGLDEAVRAAELLKLIPIDMVYTSTMTRAIETADIIITGNRMSDVPVERDKALNERSYGDLQGMNKEEAAKLFGAEQVKLWRRSYDVRPPHGESLSDTANRTIPYMVQEIMPLVKSGKNVLVVAHGNSLRSIFMFLDGLSREQVLELNIHTGVPKVYEIDSEGTVSSSYYLNELETKTVAT
jgi:2,3-bisphosphoglycerate-dependent phosphoglycerate mutase